MNEPCDTCVMRYVCSERQEYECKTLNYRFYHAEILPETDDRTTKG